MKDEYTAESWEGLCANAMEGLKAALADENISKEDLQAAVDAVEKAVKGLEKVGTPTPEPTRIRNLDKNHSRNQNKNLQRQVITCQQVQL